MAHLDESNMYITEANVKHEMLVKFRVHCLATPTVN